MLQQLGPTFIDTGKAKLIYRNFADIGPESVSAAQAALCAGDQNKYWAYANYLFTHQQGENTGYFSTGNLENFAGVLGLNTSDFKTCLESGKYAAQVQQELTQGQQRGVQATPTFFINNQKFEGVMSYDEMTAQIDSRLPK